MTIKDHYHKLYYLCYFIILIGIPLGKFFMSMGQLLLVLVWLIDAFIVNKDFKTKMQRFLSNHVALILSSLFFIHLVGFLFTVDFDYGLKDLRLKLPLLALPIILSSVDPPPKRHFFTFLKLYLAACLFGTLLSVYTLLTKEIHTIRDIVWFNSHIRFSLNIALSFFISIIIMMQQKKKREIILYLFIALWSLTYLIIQESITGLGVVLIVSMIFILIQLFKLKQLWINLSLIALLILIPATTLIYLTNVWDSMAAKEHYTEQTIDRCSKSGNNYYHDFNNTALENGYYVNLFIQNDELKQAWETRSTLSYDGLDDREQEVKYTLIRYLTSKSLRKDKEGVNALDEHDITNIEKGFANFKHAEKSNIKTRIEIIFWEYQRFKANGEISGHSLTQRFEFWRASVHIIKQHFWFGVGTGDLVIAFDKAYEEMNTKLKKENRHRSHNQYLSIFTGLGILGFIWFLFVLIWPGIISGAFNNTIYLSFFLIVVLSMFFEDTIESQAGLTFYAFFANFLILCNEDYRIKRH